MLQRDPNVKKVGIYVFNERFGLLEYIFIESYYRRKLSADIKMKNYKYKLLVWLRTGSNLADINGFEAILENVLYD